MAADTERLVSQGAEPGRDSEEFELKDRAAQHEPADPNVSKLFNPTKQTAQLAIEQGWRLAMTIILVVATVVALKAFQQHGNISHQAKIAFNTIMTVLTLALGLNFFDALKEMAKTLRWRILADHPFTVRETDLILGSDSLPRVGTLLLESYKKPLVFLCCLLWILLNITAQAGVAVISLTYSMDSGTNTTGTYTVDGKVQTPKLDCYSNGTTCPDSAETSMNRAHSYGVLSRDFDPRNQECTYANDGDILDGDQLCQYFEKRDNTEFAYRFSDYNPADNTTAYPYLTKRIIRASQGICYLYDRDGGNIPVIDSPDGGDSVWLYNFHNDTYHNHILVPKSYSAYDSTTFIYNGTETPQDETEQACGDRCLWMYAVRSLGPLSGNRPEQIFACPITMTEVSNPKDEAHNVTNEVARQAIASIALNGRYSTPVDPDKKDWHSYQIYPWGSPWETEGVDAQGFGAMVAQFAIGSIANMAPRNGRIEVPGNLPILGYHLSIHWPYAITLLAVVAGVHVLVFALMLWFARPVIVIEDSNLCTAKALQDVVARIDGGKVLDGKELANAIQKKGATNNGRTVYGVDGSGAKDAPLVLSFAEHNLVRRKLPGAAFPRGVYA
ncbi:uncharacterized protein KY384_000718 [Bacidia gigantensis]|uniref:uncharacterized protein n=1 Tax=Bacidia gigantensis TaxID=2732470 RepID=UPI001D04D4F2|nr:uncharacterized protein KY384_000718 [Bacidia gigantensis]KAG8525956.1 hypothetical protein KY384_000718 [Bacidia gigantensis]